MTTTYDIHARNVNTCQLEKLPADTPWEKIWEMAKLHPYYGLLDIALSEDAKFVVLSMNDDALALQYFWTGGGQTEPRSFAAWSALARNAAFVIDAGAYTGFYSLVAASLGSARIVAYEPVSFIYARLATNCMINGFSKIKFENAALSDFDGTMDIGMNFGPRLFSSGSTLMKNGEPTRVLRQPSKVTTIDRMHTGDPVDLLKIDVEGAETSLLRGGREVLGRHKPVVLLETRASTHHESANILHELGYELAHIESSSGADNYLCWHSQSRLADTAKNYAL